MLCAHQGKGLPEGEQWLFSKLMLNNLLLSCEVVKMTRMAAKLWLNLPAFGTMDLIAQHIYTLALLPVNLTHAGGILRYFPLLPNTCYSSDVLFTALEKLDFFPIPFPREGTDGITACDHVYADEGFHEAVFVNAWVELHLQAVHD